MGIGREGDGKDGEGGEREGGQGEGKEVVEDGSDLNVSVATPARKPFRCA